MVPPPPVPTETPPLRVEFRVEPLVEVPLRDTPPKLSLMVETPWMLLVPEQDMMVDSSYIIVQLNLEVVRVVAIVVIVVLVRVVVVVRVAVGGKIVDLVDFGLATTVAHLAK
jgi:hypothetical protein